MDVFTRLDVLAHTPAGRRWALGLILFLHVGLGIGYSLVTPIFEPPDEENHYLFVRYLQLNRALPIQGLDRDGPRGHHPPLYFVLAAAMTAWVPIEGGAERIDMALNPYVYYRYGDPAIENKAKYIHFTDAERWPYSGQALAVHVMRLLSVALSTGAVVFTYQAARIWRPEQPTFALLAAALLGFNTTVLFMSGSVQNSTAALTSGAAILWALGRGVRWGFTLRRWLVVGLALAIGILFQTSALTLTVIIGAAGLAELWRQRRRPIAVFFEGVVGVGGPVLVLVGWWFWRNQTLYGDWSANNTIAAMWTYGPIMPFLQAWYLIGTGIVGRVGQGMMIDFADGVYWAAAIVGAVSLAGLGRRARPVLTALRAATDWPARLDALLTPGRLNVLLHAAAVPVVMASLFYYMYCCIHGLHGRYAFTIFPSLACLLAFGLLEWVRPAHHARAAAGAGLIALALPVYALFGQMIPTYAPPREPSAGEIAAAQPLDAVIGNATRITAVQVEPRVIHPGDTLSVTVYWEPLARTEQPYTLFLHLFHPSVGSLVQVDRYPGSGNWATTVWDPGRPFAETFRLVLPPTAPAFDETYLVFGLYDATTMTRLAVTGADAGSAEESWVRFGTVQILPP